MASSPDDPEEMLAEINAGRRSPAWDLWRLYVRRSTSLTEAGRLVVAGGIDALSDFLGADWPARAWGTSHPLLSHLFWPGNDVPSVFVRLLELCIRLIALRRAKGLHKLRDSARSNLESTNWYHVALQLEVGALALQRGAEVIFEPRLGTRKGDVMLTLFAEATLLVEVLAMRLDVPARVAGEALEKITFWAARRGFFLSGNTGPLPVDTRNDLIGWRRDVESWTESWIARLDQAASTADSLPVTVMGPTGGVIEAMQVPAADTQLVGPQVAEGEWMRLRARISEKARQTAMGTNVWIRLDALGQLWYVTAWSQLPLAQRLGWLIRELHPSLEQHPHLSGIAISNGWAWGTTAPEEGWHSSAGAIALRRNLPGDAHRETFLIPSTGNDRQFTEWLFSLYDTEASWIDWALAQRGKPSLNDLLAGGAHGQSTD